MFRLNDSLMEEEGLEGLKWNDSQEQQQLLYWGLVVDRGSDRRCRKNEGKDDGRRRDW